MRQNFPEEKPGHDTVKLPMEHHKRSGLSNEMTIYAWGRSLLSSQFRVTPPSQPITRVLKESKNVMWRCWSLEGWWVRPYLLGPKAHAETGQVAVGESEEYHEDDVPGVVLKPDGQIRPGLDVA